MPTPVAHPLALALLAGLLLAAVVTDLRSRRIPNALVLLGLVAAFALHAGALLAGAQPLAGPEWWAPLAGLAAGLAVLMPLYLLRACGAGDCKLMAAVGAFIGTPLVLWAGLWTMAAGGLLSLLFMLRPGVGRQAVANTRFLVLEWGQRVMGGGLGGGVGGGSGQGIEQGQGIRLAPLARTAARLPYGVAIALGTATALWGPLRAPAAAALG